MLRPILVVAFVLAALAPEALVFAQQSQSSTQSSTSHTTSTSTKSTTSKSSTSTTTANANSKTSKNKNNHRRNAPPWSNSVLVNGGNAQQYLATSTPKPPPGPNKVNTGGQVFKSISN
jgi:hypothetical protein